MHDEAHAISAADGITGDSVVGAGGPVATTTLTVGLAVKPG